MFKLILIISLFATIIIGQTDELSTVDSIDLEKYSGTWFEIAKIPNSFQDHCEKNVTANYKINEEGDIIVTNSCIDYENELDEATGLARVVDKESNSKLEVSFVSILGWHLFWGDYWILELEENYNYVVVGTPSRKYGWILSRSKELKDEDLESCFNVLRQNGYDINKFEKTIQE